MYLISFQMCSRILICIPRYKSELKKRWPESLIGRAAVVLEIGAVSGGPGLTQGRICGSFCCLAIGSDIVSAKICIYYGHTGMLQDFADRDRSGILDLTAAGLTALPVGIGDLTWLSALLLGELSLIHI